MIFMLIPLIYASTRGMSEPRYLLTLFPIFSLISVYTVKEITKKFNKAKLISILFVTAILLSSIVYLDYNKIDYEYERDAYQLGLEVHKRTSVINGNFPEVVYVHNKIADVSNLGIFPILSSEVQQKLKIINAEIVDYASPKEFIDFGKNEGLTHIVADNDENKPQFLNDIFKNEEKFPYLIKIYDSSEHGYDYHVKIFRVDYEKFDSVK